MASDHGKNGGVAAAIAPEFILDRGVAVLVLMGSHEDVLSVTALAGTAKDIAALTRDGEHTFTMAGAMGAACTMGLGLALARPDRRVLVITGDGELLMNVGALATIAVMNPANLSIVCVDNGHYGETGYQQSHTSLGTDLEKRAAGTGAQLTRTILKPADIPAGAQLICEGNPNPLEFLRVKPTAPPSDQALFEQPVETIDSIMHGTINVMEAMRFLALDAKFYNAASSECFGNTSKEQPADETTMLSPRSPYAVGKAASFWAVANYREAYGLFVCNGLLFNHESPLRPVRYVTQKIVRGAVEIAAGPAGPIQLGMFKIVRDWGVGAEIVHRA